MLIGSVKTNFGHLESAAGVAAVMKVLLAMRHGVIPTHRNFADPTPAVDWQRLPLRVTSAATDWPAAKDRAPLAGVNGFGWSGTNAHVVLEGYGTPAGAGGGFAGGRLTGRARPVDASLPRHAPQPDAAPPAPRAARLLPLSGRTEEAVRELAGRYLAWLDDRGEELETSGAAADAPLSDMAWTAASGRSHMACRAGVVFRDAASLRAGLRAVADGSHAPATAAAARVAFVYTGQGSQWPGMGRSLYEGEPVFREVLERCEAVIVQERGASLLDVLFGGADAGGDLYDAAWGQPAIYALECALTALWASVGVRPGVVIGHSLGGVCGGAGGGGVRPGRRPALRRAARRPAAGRTGVRRHGGGVRAAGSGWRQPFATTTPRRTARSWALPWTTARTR